MVDENLITEIQSLRDQGLVDAIILQELESQGYPQDQVEETINYMDSSQEVENFQDETEMEFPVNDIPEEAGEQETEVETDPTAVYHQQIEEVIDTLIDERWELLLKEVKKIIEWKEKLELNQRNIERDVYILQQSFATLQKDLTVKLDVHSESIGVASTLLSNLHRVFSEVMPQMEENVRQVSDHFFPKNIPYPPGHPLKRKRVLREKEPGHAPTIVHGTMEHMEKDKPSRHYHD